MSRLFADAIRIFETAAQGSEDLGILIDDAGALRIVPGDGWRAEALREHYGARSVFHVTRNASGLRVEANSASYSCVLSENGCAAGRQPAPASQMASILPLAVRVLPEGLPCSSTAGTS